MIHLLTPVTLMHSPFRALQACGSSGTTAGLALGAKLAGLGAQVHAYGVCDSPEYFYAEIDGLLQQLGYTETGGGCKSVNIVWRL
jgi:1-aminocyclopropane-1-carboxylate deaminase/D-cysteine desulfhydrase-like pyridoxal-dependent ACC family enzyme